LTVALLLDVYSHVTGVMQEDAAAKIDAALRPYDLSAGFVCAAGPLAAARSGPCAPITDIPPSTRNEEVRPTEDLCEPRAAIQAGSHRAHRPVLADSFGN
jgi:hypothetical protein